MDSTAWRDYLLRVQHAGFVNQALVTSKNAIVNGYAFYICGRKAGVPKSKLDEMIARWVFGTLLTARCSTSSETVFEQDLARIARFEQSDADGFLRALDGAMGETLTGDYWTLSLVSSRRRRHGLPLHWHSERPRSFLGPGPFSRINHSGTCSTPRHLVLARLAKPTTYFLRPGSIRAGFGSVAL